MTSQQRSLFNASWTARLLKAGIAAGVVALAGCSGSGDPGTGTSTGTGGSGPAGGGTSPNAPCTSAPTAFSSTVLPSLKTDCALCHSAGQVAGGTGLILVTGGTDVQNYNNVRNYVRVSAANEGLLLSKSIGQPTHSGGAPYVNSSSAKYQALAASIPEMKQSCGTTPVPAPPVAGGFWTGVSFIDNPTTLAKAANIFASRNPTAAEYQAVATGGEPALRATIRSYMTGPAFNALLDEFGDTHLLAPRVVVFGNNMGLNATDYPTSADLINNTNFDQNVRNRFQASVRREGVELMKYIVNNDRPWTDAVAGNYTVMNGNVARFMAATVDGPFTDVNNDNEWRRATWKSERLGGVREHAGIISTHSWLQNFPTTPTNRNRHRVYILLKQFAGTDITALAARPIDDNAAMFRVTWMENPGCKTCHDVMDPIAAGFRNWNEGNRFLPNRDSTNVDHALPATYRANNYPRKADGTAYYQLGDNWFRDSMPPGYNGVPMPGGFGANPTALQWLGQQVAADPRFAIGAVNFWYEGVFGRAPLQAPADQTSPQYPYLLAAYNAQHQEFLEIAGRFATNRGSGTHNVRDLLVDLVMSKWYRATSVQGLNAGRSQELYDIGTTTMITPARLQRKMVALLGTGFAGFNNPYAGDGLNYGNFNGVDRISRQQDFTMLQTTTSDRFAASMACGVTQADFNRAVGSRLLFPNVTMNDTPATTAGADAITQNVRHLHNWLLKENLAANDPEIQRTVGLFNAVWNDRATAPVKAVNCTLNANNDANYTGRAWAAVISLMMRDPKFLFD